MTLTPPKHKDGFVYNETAKAIHNGETIVVHQGGTGSGKTYEILLFLIFEVGFRFRNKVVTIASESYPHIWGGAFRDFKNIMQFEQLWHDERFNQQRMTYTFPSGTIFEFVSTDRVGRALGHRRFLLYVNEVNNNKREVVDEMSRRSRFIIYDFNPTAQFYLEEMLQYYGPYALIKSNVYNNDHIDPVERARILLRASMDPNFHRVHILCEYGTAEGLVYQNYEIIDEFPLTLCDVVVYGLDWGYVNDPTVLLMVGVHGEDTYVDELIYQTGLTNRAITDKLRQWGFSGREIIYADVDPKSIDELKLAGFSIRQVKKGMVEDEVRRMRDGGRIYITKRSVNTIKEIRNYRFATDRGGKPLNVPVKADDHAMDAMRYARLSVSKNRMTWT